MTLDALKATETIRRRMVDFTLDDRHVKNDSLRSALAQIWNGPPEQGGLVSDLWVEPALPPSESVESLETLLSKKLVSEEMVDQLDHSGGFKRTWKLRTHQEEAVHCGKAGFAKEEKPALVVSAGTGAGKTESFLLPILSDLFARDAQTGQGISCLILYPMNALVNDQVERIHGWLKGQDKIRLFHFTSETPEDVRAANRANYPDFSTDLCRVRTRQQARCLENENGRLTSMDPAKVRPPEILITNYSMLEYMLCRPQDAMFFGKNLRSIVLDEAHLYSGTLAAEIALLLRRVLLRCGKKPQEVFHFATSATLTEGADTQSILKGFAGKLFTKDPDLVQVVQGTPQQPIFKVLAKRPTKSQVSKFSTSSWPSIQTIQTNDVGEASFTALSKADLDSLRTLLSDCCVGEAFSNSPDLSGPWLYQALRNCPIFIELHQTLLRCANVSRAVALSDLAQSWCGFSDLSAQETVRRLLLLGAQARLSPDEHPLLPNRIHLQVRPPDGITVYLQDPESRGKQAGQLWLVGGHEEICPTSKQHGLSLFVCTQCGESYLAGRSDGPTLASVAPSDFAEEKANNLQLCYFQIPTLNQKPNASFNVSTGRLSGPDDEGILLTRIKSDTCVSCNAGKDHLQPFRVPTRVLQSILAESLLLEVPPVVGDHHSWMPAEGRRILIFSDSRNEAARLGPRLTELHETQLFRSAVTKSLESASDVQEQMLQDDIIDLRRRLGSLATNTPYFAELQNKITLKERELVDSQGGVEPSKFAERISYGPASGLVSQLRAYGRTGTPDLWTKDLWSKNETAAKTELSQRLAYELARRPTWPHKNLETLSLVEVHYPATSNIVPPSSFLGLLPANVSKTLTGTWPSIIRLYCDSLRMQGIVTTGCEPWDDEYPHGSFLVGRYCSLRPTEDWIENFGTHSTENRRHRLARMLLQKSGLDEAVDEQAKNLLEAVWQQLQGLPFVQQDGEQLRINFANVKLVPCRQVFQCPSTGEMWSYHALGIVPTEAQVDPVPVPLSDLENGHRSSRSRRELMEEKALSMALWACEHSAQLSATQNRRLQNLFKQGAVNVLSSTTTLELGVDIGGLSAAILANVPPGKANYLQRAGRVGRRSDGSSLVVTFCHNRPYDAEVFHNFGRYLSTPLRKPKVIFDRERVALRHFHAWLLGEFFRAYYGPNAQAGAMTAFKSMGFFCGLPQVSYWSANDPKPSPTTSPLDMSSIQNKPWFQDRAGVSLADLFGDFAAWYKQDPGELEKLGGVLGFLWSEVPPLRDFRSQLGEILSEMTDTFLEKTNVWKNEYNQLLKTWNEIKPQSTDRARANANRLYYRLKILHQLTVIEVMASAQFLPRYGFPIGLYRLHVARDRNLEADTKDQRTEDPYSLERSSLLALREYVPGSVIVAGGDQIVSRGLLKHWSGEDIGAGLGLTGVLRDLQDGTTEWDWGGKPTEGKRPKGEIEFITPRYGFTTAAWDKPRRAKELDKVGKANVRFRMGDLHDSEIETIPIHETSRLSSKYVEDGKLLVENRGNKDFGFAICLRCGFAETEDNLVGKAENQKYSKLSRSFEKHRPIFQSKGGPCWEGKEGRSPVLRNHAFAAEEVTDVLLLDFTRWSQQGISALPAIAEALRLAGANLLGLSSRELGYLIPGSTGLIAFYDNVPGGAGHVRAMAEFGEHWLKKAVEQLHVDDAHHQSCVHGCTRCILTFETQNAFGGRLDRRGAYSILTDILNGEHSPAQKETSPPTNETTPPDFDRWLSQNRPKQESKIGEWKELRRLAKSGCMDPKWTIPYQDVVEQFACFDWQPSYEISGSGGASIQSILALPKQQIALIEPDIHLNIEPNGYPGWTLISLTDNWEEIFSQAIQQA